MDVERIRKAYELLDEEAIRHRVILPEHKPVTIVAMAEDVWNKLGEIIREVENEH